MVVLTCLLCGAHLAASDDSPTKLACPNCKASVVNRPVDVTTANPILDAPARRKLWIEQNRTSAGIVLLALIVLFIVGIPLAMLFPGFGVVLVILMCAIPVTALLVLTSPRSEELRSHFDRTRVRIAYDRPTTGSMLNYERHPVSRTTRASIPWDTLLATIVATIALCGSALLLLFVLFMLV